MIKIKENYETIPVEIQEKLSKSNVYYSKEYYEYIQKKYQNVLYVYNNYGILVIFIRKQSFFRIADIPTEIYFFDDISSQKKVEFLDDTVKLLKKKYRIDCIGPTSATALFDVSPTNAIKIPFGSHIIDLSLPSDEIWKKIHGKHKNVIRKAIKDDVKIECGGVEFLDEYLAMDIETLQRSNIRSHGRDYYKELITKMSQNIKVYISYKDEKPQAGAIFLYNKSMCYYLYGCSINHSYAGAANLLQWEAIQDMKSLGVEYFSFVGCRINENKNSKYHSIQRFKERFGGELFVGEMFKVIHSPYKYKLLNIYRYIKYNKGRPFAIDIIDQEIKKWK